MSVDTSNWQGASKLVNIKRARFTAPWFVAEYRLRAMSKWAFELVGFGLGNPIIYLFGVGLGIGSLINRQVDGVTYLQFLAPALLATAAISAAMDECMFPVMEGFVWVKSFWTISATQVTPRQIAVGIWISAAIRTAATIVLYQVVLLAFNTVPVASIAPQFVSALLGGLTFGVVMMAATSFRADDGQFINVVFRFVVVPMFLFSGTFFPLSQTPIYLQWIGWLSPLWHSTDLGRFLSYGADVEPWLIAVHVGYLALLGVVGFAVTFKQFDKRLLT